MIPYESICKKVRSLMQKYETRDPFILCDKLAIPVHFFPMGRGAQICKGFFVRYCRVGVITINSDLSAELQRIICAHELGHAVLHKKEAGFQEVTLFRTADVKEQEANLFAAELLLGNDRVLSVLNQDITFFEAAALLDVPVELLDFKFRILKWQGFQVVDTPVQARSNYLKNVVDGGVHYDDI